MIRLEREQRFYEVDVVGVVLLARSGKIGTDGKETLKSFDSREKAEKEAKRRVTEKKSEGFAEISIALEDEKRDPELEAAILDAPDDAGRLLVYGDHLLAEGDLRGELCALQGGADQEAAAKFLEKHKARFSPPKTTQMAKKPRHGGKAESGYTELEWAGGFIRKARLARNSDRPPITVREMVNELLTHPSARLLDDLTIGALGTEQIYDYATIIAAIVRAAPSSLRSLFVGDFVEGQHTEIGFSALGDVSSLSVMPRLRRLRLRGGTVTLGDLLLPNLESFALETQSLSSTLVRSLAMASWQNLTRLEVKAKAAEVELAVFDPLLQGTGVRRLRSLGLQGTKATQQLLAALLRAPLLRQLEVLDLAGGDLDDEAAKVLAQSDATAHLAVLDLRSNQIGEGGVRLLANAAKDVKLDDQRSKASAGLVVTDVMVQRFAEDAKSVSAARKLAKHGEWTALGYDAQMLWGTYPGSSGTYEVFADVASMQSGCTCPSRKYPCKHALGLLLLAADGHPFREGSPPDGLVDRAESARYTMSWE